MEPAYGPVQVHQDKGRVKKDKVKGGGSRAGKRKSNLVEEPGEDYRWESSQAYHVRMVADVFVLAVLLLFLYLSAWRQWFGDYSSNVSRFLSAALPFPIIGFFANWRTALKRKKLEKELNLPNNYCKL